MNDFVQVTPVAADNATAPQPAIVPVVTSVVAPQPTVVDTGGLPLPVYEHLKARHNIVTVAPSVLHVTGRMISYCENMSAASHIRTQDIGATYQRDLYHTFLYALSAAPGEYLPCLTVILYYFDTRAADVFSDRLLYRFTATSSMTRLQKECFSNLCTLFQQTANPATRRIAVSRLEMPKYIAQLPDEITKQNLLAYYTMR